MTDVHSLDHVLASDMGCIFRPDNVLFSPGFRTNATILYYLTEISELLDYVLDTVRKEVELCDSPQGFQLCFSLGGVMSQMASMLQCKLKEGNDHFQSCDTLEWPDKLALTYNIYPSSFVSDTVIEPYVCHIQ